MLLKEMLKKELKKEYFPYKGKENFEEKIQLNYTDKNIVAIKKYSKNVVVIKEYTCNLMFIYTKDELVILIITDSDLLPKNWKKLNKLTEIKTTTKIDIISSNKFEKENKEMLDIINLVSENSQDLRYLLSMGAEEYFKYNSNYLFWYLTNIEKRIYLKRQYKRFFLLKVMKVISNKLSNKKDIEELEYDMIKDSFLSYFFKRLINKKTVIPIYNNILYNSEKIFSDTLFSQLLSIVKYNEEEFKIYFLINIAPTFVDDLKEYIFNNMMEQEYIDYVNKLLYGIKTFNRPTLDMEDYLNLILKFIEYIDEIFKDKELFKLNNLRVNKCELINPFIIKETN